MNNPGYRNTRPLPRPRPPIINPFNRPAPRTIPGQTPGPRPVLSAYATGKIPLRFAMLTAGGSLPGFAGLGDSDSGPDDNGADNSVINLPGVGTGNTSGSNSVFPSLFDSTSSSSGALNKGSLFSVSGSSTPSTGNSWIDSLTKAVSSLTGSYSQVLVAQGTKTALANGLLPGTLVSPNSSLGIAASLQMSTATKVMVFGGIAVALVLVLSGGSKSSRR